jgi:Mrp family chromosome partitioning ATPase
MDVVAYLRILRRHWGVILAAVLVGALVGAATTLLQADPPAEQRGYYKATNTQFFDLSSRTDGTRPVYTNIDQMAVLLTTGDVPKRVADELGGDPKELVTHIMVTSNGTLATLDITAVDRDPEQAVRLADTFAEQLTASIQNVEQTRINQTRDDTIQRLDSVQAQINALDAQIAARPPNVDLLTAQRNSLVNQYRTTYERFQAIANSDAVSTPLSTLQSAEAEEITKSEYDARILKGRLGENRVRADLISDSTDPAATSSSSTTNLDSPVARGVLGGFIGLILGISLAFVLERADRRLRLREEFEDAYGMPVLAEIPRLKSTEQKSFEVISRNAPFSRTAEGYRAVRSSLLFQRPTRSGAQTSTRALTVMVSSAVPREGKSTTAANLATVFAEGGQRVLAVNCDFRRPTLHKFFHTENEPRRLIASGLPNLVLVSDVTGPDNPNPSQVIEQQRRTIENSHSRFDVVVLDTAPLLSTNDAAELLDLVDLVLVVAQVGESTSDNARRTRELLARLDAPVAGLVIVGSDAVTNDDYYYYYSRDRAKDLEQRAGTVAPRSNGTNGNEAPEPAAPVAPGTTDA